MLLNSFRLVSLLEGLSFLGLLFASLVQKRLWGQEDAIFIPGMIHGVLFLLFCLLLFFSWEKYRWPLKAVGSYFLASLLPFAFIFIEHKIKKNL